ncbi:MAG: hypothetical protein R6U96_13300 [Promethearchaeia archaeon]
MYQILQLIGIFTYIAVFSFVLITVFIYSDEETKRISASITILLLLLMAMVFIRSATLQFLLFIFVLLDAIHLIFTQFIPQFYSRSESILFIEVPKEIWEQTKVQDTIIKQKQRKNKR